MNVEDALTALPRCPTCSVPQVGDDCLYCRAMDLEAKLARVSFWGTDDWMRKIASLAAIDRPNDQLYPLGFYEDFKDRSGQRFTFHVTAQPQVGFRPVWLTIAPECAHMGTLLDCRTGNRSQFVSPDPLPMSLFCPNAWGSLDVAREVVGKFKWDTVSVAQQVVLSIDVSLHKYDEPVVELAHESLHGPRPTAFKAILWGKRLDLELPHVSPIYMVGPHNVGEVEATLRFHDVVEKLRGSDPKRVIEQLARPLLR